MAAGETVPEQPLARVIPLRALRPRSCFICTHVTYRDPEDPELSGDATFCPVFIEFIDSETYAAEDCGAYEEDGDAR